MKKLIIKGVFGILVIGVTLIIGLDVTDDEKNIEMHSEIANTVQTTSEIHTESTTTVQKTEKATTKVRTTGKKVAKSTNNSGKYKITHYGPDCRGCSGITASGYNVKNTIYYNDSEYGQVRVVATSKQFKLYSIIKIKNYRGTDTIAIVLDRGVGSGVIDMLVSSEKQATQLGIQKNVEIELLRSGK